MKAFTRLFAAALVCALLLSGCGRAMESQNPNHIAPEENATPAPQEEMPGEELKAALKRLEFSAIAAAVAAEDERRFLKNGNYEPMTVLIGDLDGDRDEELVFGSNAFLMDSSEGKLLRYTCSESGFIYLTDRNGLSYLHTYKGADFEYRRGHEYDPNSDDCWPLPDHLDSAWAVSIAEWYYIWNGSGLTERFSYANNYLMESLGFSDEVEPFYREEYVELASGERLEDEAALAYLEGLALQAVTTTARNYTENSYDSKYQQSICQALDGYFREGYGSYGGCVTADVDEDGEEEQVFLLPGLLSPWEASARQQEQPWDVSYEFDLKQPRTAVLLADRQGDRVVFRAGCVFGDYRPDSGSSARMDGFFLNVDGVSYPLGSLFGNTRHEELYPQLAEYLSSLGFREPVLLRADLTDMDGEDLICLCQKDGTWYIVIICVIDGYPVPLLQMDTSSTACYLVQVDGKDCLLTYKQNMYQGGNGGYSTGYGYTVWRYDAQGTEQIVDSKYVHYSEGQQDATELSGLMEALKKYLVKIIVVRDPYALTGQTWVQSSDIAYGAPPEEETDAPQEEGTLGFVQIQHPSSWLHLREGPGTEYDRVLVDPADPESFVRQALGSPVTVLETIETGDSENPVWVKIRIRYQDREFIGYSSKRYIRLQGES